MRRLSRGHGPIGCCAGEEARNGVGQVAEQKATLSRSVYWTRCRIPGEMRRCPLKVRGLSHYPCAHPTPPAPCVPYPPLPRLLPPVTRPPTCPAHSYGSAQGFWDNRRISRGTASPFTPVGGARHLESYSPLTGRHPGTQWPLPHRAAAAIPARPLQTRGRAPSPHVARRISPAVWH